MVTGQKKLFIIAGSILLALILIFAGLAIYFHLTQKAAVTPKQTPSIGPEQQLVEQQLKALNQMKSDKPPLTEQETTAQLKELANPKSPAPSLSPQDIQKQLEQLNNLKKP
jgi:hypothetical protein